MPQTAYDVVFVTRGGHVEGMGDVTSSIALAQEFQASGYSVFFAVNDNDRVHQLLRSNGMPCETMDSAGASLAKITCRIGIINQLKSTETEIAMLRKIAGCVVTIDDDGPASVLADLRFNALYPTARSHTSFRYLSLGPQFQSAHVRHKKIRPEVERILVTQGGSDTYGFTPMIIEAIAHLSPRITLDVVIGPEFQHQKLLNKALVKAGRMFCFHRGLNDLAPLIEQADIAISAGGFTLFECACLGTPAVVVCGEPFEVATAERLKTRGFGVNLGFGKELDSETVRIAVDELIGDFPRRESMSRRGKQLVDGRGVSRIVGKIIEKMEIT